MEVIAFNLRDCVDETMRPMEVRAHQKGLGLHFDIGPEVPGNVVGDPIRLGQILINLVGNAIKGRIWRRNAVQAGSTVSGRAVDIVW